MKAPRCVLVHLVLCLAVYSSSTTACVAAPDIEYRIDVTLDTEQKVLRGVQKVVYSSGADVPLTEIYMHLYANAYRGRESTAASEAEENLRDFTVAHSGDSKLGYIEIESLTVNGQTVSYEIDDTVMRILLSSPLTPGNSIVIRTAFVTKIPGIRHRFCFKGRNFSIAQWYPKMAVYDSHGWHTDKYHLIGEFFGDFATFDVNVTLPQEYYVGATGYLVDAVNGDNDMPHISEEKDSVFAQRRRMKEAIEAGQLTESKTLAFHAEKVHDFAWVASPRYVKDEAEWNGVAVKTLVFREHAKGKWKKLLEYSLDAIQFWTEQVGPYPYSHLTVAEAYSHPNGGMEYPALSMIDPLVNMPYTNALDIVTAHEIGHIWWYGAMANDELNEPWLDEGFNQYYTIRYAEWKYHEKGAYDPPGFLAPLFRVPYKREQELVYLAHVATGRETVVAQPAYSQRDYLDYGAVMYIKGSCVLDMLNYMVGDSLFDEIIRTYYQQYQFTHPTTDDFIAVAEEVSGQKLDWYFQQWLHTSGTCDYAVGKLGKSVPDSSSSGYVTEIVVERKGDIVMPVEIEARLANGEHAIKRVLADERQEHVTFRTAAPVKKVIIDPRQRLLETNRLNNHSGFLPPLKLTGLFRFGELTRSDRYIVMVNPDVRYNTIDKWKLGVRVTGSHLLSKNQVSAGVLYATDSEKFGYQGSFSTRFSSVLARGTGVGIRLHIDNGMRNYSIWLSVTGGGFPLTMPGGKGIATYPVLGSRLGLSYSDKFDDRYFDADWYSVGKTLIASGRLWYAQRSYHGLTRLKLNAASGLDLFDANYTFNKILFNGSQDFRLIRTGEMTLRITGRAGRVWGEAPVHQKLHIGQGVPSSTVDPLGALFTAGGGGVRGYQYEPILGDRLYSANMELRSEILKWLLVTPILFCDAGQVTDDSQSPLTNKVLWDAGIEFSLMNTLSFSFPLFLSDPPDDKDNVAFRVVLLLRSAI